MTVEPTFFDIRNRILEWPGLSLPAKTIWISLCQYSWTDGSCYHSRQTLAENHGMTLALVKRARKELTDKGLVTVFKRPLPATAVTFPFVKFQDIEQRDKNVVRLENQMGSKSTLLVSKENNNIQDQWGQNDTYNGVKIDPIDRVKIDPHKRKVLKENIKEEQKKNGIEPYAVGNGIDTIHLAVASQPEVVKKPRTTKHKASREEQLDKIKANLDDYKTQYPEIDINLEIENFEYWLANYPKGKMRKDLFATWKNWLHREHVQQAKRKKQPVNKINKREFDPEEFNRYVSEFNG